MTFHLILLSWMWFFFVIRNYQMDHLKERNITCTFSSFMLTGNYFCPSSLGIVFILIALTFSGSASHQEASSSWPFLDHLLWLAPVSSWDNWQTSVIILTPLPSTDSSTRQEHSLPGFKLFIRLWTFLWPLRCQPGHTFNGSLCSIKLNFSDSTLIMFSFLCSTPADLAVHSPIVLKKQAVHFNLHYWLWKWVHHFINRADFLLSCIFFPSFRLETKSQTFAHAPNSQISFCWNQS